MKEQEAKAVKALEMYTQRQEMIRKKQNDKVNNFHQTTLQHMSIAHENQRAKEQHESQIRLLEEAEMQALNKMRDTMAQK